jgi:hypothetical protein
MNQNKEKKANQFSVDFEVPEAEEGLDVGVLERHEAEAFAAAGLAVQHDGRVDNFSELGEKFAHGLGGDAARETADEELRCALVLLPWDRAFRVYLEKRIRTRTKRKSAL